jgi:hypothetical protein
MNITRKLAIGAAGALGALGVGGGVAFAQSSSSSTVSPTTLGAPALTPAAASDVAPELPGATTETPGVAEPSEASLPGGDHADTAGQNAYHQFQGVE